MKTRIFLLIFFALSIFYIHGYNGYAPSPIFNAINENDIETVSRIADSYMNIWSNGPNGEYPLMYAVRVSNLQAVICLIPYYSDTTILNNTNNNSKNILDIANEQYNSEILNIISLRVLQELEDPQNFEMAYKLLFTKNEFVRNWARNDKLDLNITNEDGLTLLQYSCQNRSTSYANYSSSYFRDTGNKAEFAEFLIQYGINIDAVNSRNETALFLAIDNGYTEVASYLIDSNADPDIITEYEDTALRQSLVENNIQIFMKLVEAGADLNILDDYGNSVLAESIDDEKFDYARILIDAGADVNLKEGSGYTPLYEACDESDTELVRLLIENGADVNSLNGRYNTPALLEVMYPENYELVSLLLENGADANGKNSIGQNALFYVSSTYDSEIIKLVIEYGADVNAINEYGNTPILDAVCFGRFDLLAIYKDYGGDFTVTDNDGENGLHYAVRGAVPESFEILHTDFVTGHELSNNLLSYFLDVGININAQNIEGQTPLMLAATGEYDLPQYVQILLEHNADPNLRDIDNNTALMYSIGRPRIMQKLIDAGADPYITNSDGNTALDLAEEWAIEYSNNNNLAECARILSELMNISNRTLLSLNEAILLGYRDQILENLEVIEDINQTDEDGKTAVYCAVSKQDIETLQLLIDNNADINAGQTNWLTPLILALTIADNEIVKMLIDSGADVNLGSYDGYSFQSPLRKAMGNSSSSNLQPNIEAIRYLIEAGADIEWEDRYGESELMYACRNSSQEVVQYLIDRGASIFDLAQWNYQEKSIFDVASYANKPIIEAELESRFMNKVMRTTDYLNLRTNQNTYSDIIIILNTNSPVEIIEIGETDEFEGICSCWVKVKTLEGASDAYGNSRIGYEGWIFAGYLNEYE